MYFDVTERAPRARALAVALSVAGLAVASVGALYIAGAFGLSTATAAGIVRAFEIGGWALTIALAIFSFGTGAAITLVLRSIVAKWTTKVVVA